MRTLGGVLLGLLLFFPGIVLLRWVSVNVLGAYDALTLTDGCLVMIIILLCVNLVRGISPVGVHSRSRHQRRPTRTAELPTEPQLQFLSGDEARRERRRPTGRRPAARRRER